MVYGRSGQNAPHYRAWNGTAWSGESAGPTATDVPVFITLARDSGSDTQVLWSNGHADLNVAKWNGTTMGAATLIDDNIAGTTTTEPFSMIIPTTDPVSKPRIVQWREAAAQ